MNETIIKINDTFITFKVGYWSGEFCDNSDHYLIKVHTTVFVDNYIDVGCFIVSDSQLSEYITENFERIFLRTSILEKNHKTLSELIKNTLKNLNQELIKRYKLQNNKFFLGNLSGVIIDYTNKNFVTINIGNSKAKILTKDNLIETNDLSEMNNINDKSFVFIIGTNGLWDIVDNKNNTYEILNRFYEDNKSNIHLRTSNPNEIRFVNEYNFENSYNDLLENTVFLDSGLLIDNVKKFFDDFSKFYQIVKGKKYIWDNTTIITLILQF